MSPSESPPASPWCDNSPASPRTAWLAAGLVSLLAFVVLLPSLGDRPFYTTGEPREAAVVRAMWDGGSRILPRVDGHRLPSKPPLYHWIALGISEMRGTVDETSSRLPSVLLAALTVGLVVHAGAVTWGAGCGVLAGVILMSTLEWIHQARVARVDATLGFFLTLVLVAVMRARTAPTSTASRAAFSLGVLGATLTKGPAGALLPLTLVAFEGLLGSPSPVERRGLGPRLSRARAFLGANGALLALGLTSVVAGSWTLAAWWIGGNEFAEQLILKENVLRVLDPERLGTGHRHGLFYLVPKLFLGGLPFSLMAPALVVHLVRSRPLAPATRWLVVWTCGVLFLFSLAASKRAAYLLPVYPAAALLLAHLVVMPALDRPTRFLMRQALIGAAAVVALSGGVVLILAFEVPLPAAVPGLLSTKDQQGFAAVLAGVQRQAVLVAGAASGVSLLGMLAIALARNEHFTRATVATAAALALVTAGLIPPLEGAIATERSPRAFARAALRRTGNTDCALLGEADHALGFYIGRPLARPGSLAAAAARGLTCVIAPARVVTKAPPGWAIALQSSSRGESGHDSLVLLQRDTPR